MQGHGLTPPCRKSHDMTLKKASYTTKPQAQHMMFNRAKEDEHHGRRRNRLESAWTYLLWNMVTGIGVVRRKIFATIPIYGRFAELRDITAAGYTLLGVGPVIGFAIWLKKQDHPLRWTQLIGLGICAIIPFIWVAYNV